jgi:hypothetical protein
VWKINGAARTQGPDGSYMTVNLTGTGIESSVAFFLASGTAAGNGQEWVGKSSSSALSTTVVNPWNLTTTASTHNVFYTRADIPVAGQPMDATDGPFAEGTWTNTSGANATPHWTIIASYTVDVYPMAIGLLMTL